MKRRSSVPHTPIPMTDGREAVPVCIYCRKAIAFRPQVEGRGAHWTHLPRPRVLSTYGRG